ncbi:MAG: ATP-binding protein [Candidatus Aenigmarchaeota archaeon]|nr:ATP-binding protein [Candidatus Aenigmarchaeota archaeon]
MRYNKATTENLDEKTKEAIEDAITKQKGIFIFGDTGTGKTYTMHALANHKKVYVDNWVILLSKFRDLMQKGEYFMSIHDFTNEDYVFIDDIGAEKTSDFVVEFLYTIINKRYENMKRTVLSTNLTLEDFGERYGDRILSRIAEMCIFLELKGEDQRLIINKK